MYTPLGTEAFINWKPVGTFTLLYAELETRKMVFESCSFPYVPTNWSIFRSEERRVGKECRL